MKHRQCPQNNIWHVSMQSFIIKGINILLTFGHTRQIYDK